MKQTINENEKHGGLHNYMNIYMKVDAFEMNIVVSASPCSSIKSVLFVEQTELFDWLVL